MIEVTNDGVPGTGRGSGYGITGMAERMAPLGGVVEAGPQAGQRWRVAVRLPLGPEDDPFDHLPRWV